MPFNWASNSTWLVCDHGITTEVEENFAGSCQLCITPSFRFLEKYRRVNTKTIQNCFGNCLKHSDLEMPEKADSENDVILEMHYVGNYEEFSCIGNSLQCYNENEDCEDATVEQIVANHQKTSKCQETDEVDTTERERVTNQDAGGFIAGLRLYFMQEGYEVSPVSALETCADCVQLQADCVQLQSIKRTRQGTLDQFLQRH
jgi:hypothetical protein